jgi:hypothetical protein
MAPHKDSFFERFDRDNEVKAPSGRVFAMALALPFALAGFSPLLRHGQVRWWAVYVAAALLLVGAIFPKLLDPVSVVWTRALRPVRQAFTTVAMALLFFLVVTPIGLLRRVRVRDPLHMRFERERESYWQERQPVPPESMLNQF